MWKLNKAIYGLKQASRAWYFKLQSVLQSLGFVVSAPDPAIFYRYEDDGYRSFLFVFVDDIIIAHTSQATIDSIKAEIRMHLQITDNGQLHSFTGIELVRGSDQSVFIHQTSYAHSVINKFHTYATSKSTPLPPGTHLSKLNSSRYEGEHPNNVPADALLYRQLIYRISGIPG